MVLLFSVFSGQQLLADTFVVLASYHEASKAQENQTVLQNKLSTEIRVVPATVSGAIWYRLVVPEAQFTGSVSARVSVLGISPWRFSQHSKPGQQSETLPQIAAVQQSGSLLVAELSDISQALALERKLSEGDLPVYGKALLAQGKVVHQIWVGPVEQTEALLTKLSSLNLSVLATAIRPEPEASLPPADALAARKGSPDQDPSATGLKTPKSKTYPTDFNFARLPERANPPQ